MNLRISPFSANISREDAYETSEFRLWSLVVGQVGNLSYSFQPP